MTTTTTNTEANNKLHEGMQRGIEMQTASAVRTLEEIIKYAEGALRLIESGKDITYTHSEINHIGDRYEELIRTIERLNTLKSVDYYYGNKTGETQ